MRRSISRVVPAGRNSIPTTQNSRIPSGLKEIIRILFLNGLQISDDSTDLIALEFELRHIRMAGDDALAQGFLQRLDRVALRQATKQGGLRMSAFAGAGGRMATRAFLGEKSLSPLKGSGILCARRRRGEHQTKPKRRQPHAQPPYAVHP